MKKNLIFAILASFVCLTTAFAQPSPVKKAAKSMFKLTTFNAEGKILNTAYGAFVGSNGECLSTWTPFVGASSATVIDAQGRKYDVDCVVGANEIYNVSKFRVKVPTDKKMVITPLTIATTQVAEGGETWLVSYDVKAPTAKMYSPMKVETFMDNLPYYIYEQTADDEMAGSPFLNSLGELIGLMEPSKKRTDLYCASSQYAVKMEPTGLTANEATMRQTDIRIALPTDQNQALLALVMAQSNTYSTKFLATAEEFIGLFPTAYEGYNAKAEYLSTQEDFAAADAIMKEGIEKAEKKDEAHHAFSKLIYDKAVNYGDSIFPAWSFDSSLTEIENACNINPLPFYNMHKARVLFGQKRYQDAYNTFIELTKTNMRSAECFYDASLCLQALKESDEKVLEMLDSAVACFDKPYKANAAPYILVRGRKLDEMGQPRKAMHDFMEYETAMNGMCNAAFYYEREQLLIRAKAFQPALNDIAHAAALEPGEKLYLAELALLSIKLNQQEHGEQFAKLCMERFPEYGDGYAIYGLALIRNNNKKEGMSYLEKAKEMGSEMAQPLIEKYK